MKIRARLLLLSAAAIFAPGDSLHAAEVTQRVPRHRQEDVLVALPATAERRYLAFPALLDPGDDVLVSYKRGSRADASGAGLS